MYRWIERFDKEGKEGLKDKSKRPHKLFKLKVTDEGEQLILSIRKRYKYGQKRISAHLLRHHGLKLSSTTVWRILDKHQVAPVKKTYRSTKRKRYNRPVPLDRVQIDVTKVGPRCYQFTAIDDCTRLRVLRLYPDKTADRSLTFLLNPKDKTLNLTGELTQWEEFYNKQRSHSSLQGKTPWEKYLEVQHQVPTYDPVGQLYTQKKEEILARNYTFIQWKKKHLLS